MEEAEADPVQPLCASEDWGQVGAGGQVSVWEWQIGLAGQ